MLLGEVFQAMNSWRALAVVKMQPQMAYKVLKYVRLVSAEWEIIEKQRVALIYEVSGAVEGRDVKLEPDSEEFAEYVKKFNEVLQTESDLKEFRGSLDGVMAAVRDDDGNVLSVSDLATLEGFFATEDEALESPAVAGKIGD